MERSPDMNRRTRSIFWQAIGGGCYLLGLVVFLLTFVGVYFAPPANSLANLAPVHGAGMGVGVGLLLLGKAITWRFGEGDPTGGRLPGDLFDTGPDRNRLQELGYNVPPDEEDPAPHGYEDGEVYLRCPDCGKRNDTDYRFCANCSAELPDAEP